MQRATCSAPGALAPCSDLPTGPGAIVSRSGVDVLAADDRTLLATATTSGQGRVVHLSGGRHDAAGARRLEDAIRRFADRDSRAGSVRGS